MICLITNDSCQKLPCQVEASNWSVVPTSVPLFESFITRIVLSLTNYHGTSPTFIHSFKTVARTSCTAVKDFNEKPWILSGPAPFQSGIDFNFLLTSSLYSVFQMASSLLLCQSIMNPAYARLLYSIFLSKMLLHLQHSVVLSPLLYLQEF